MSESCLESQAKQVVRTLTEQAAIVVRNRGTAYGRAQYSSSVMRPMEKAGLFERLPMRPGFQAHWTLTKLGEAVRVRLLTTPETSDER